MSTFNDAAVYRGYELRELGGQNQGWEARKCRLVGDLNAFCSKIKGVTNLEIKIYRLNSIKRFQTRYWCPLR